MSNANKITAFLSYLLLIIGWVYVFIFQRHNQFQRYHARQAMTILGVALITFVAWIIVAWLVTFIQLLGPVLAISLYSLAMVVFLGLIVSWITGMANALRGMLKPVPFVGHLADRLPF